MVQSRIIISSKYEYLTMGSIPEEPTIINRACKLFTCNSLLKKFILILLLLPFDGIGHTQSYFGSIIRVIDGDTFVFQTDEGSLTVRMFGIDAPERDQRNSKESVDFLKQYLHKEATIKPNGVDRYGRTLGILFIKNQDINLMSIKYGCSWHYKQYSKDIQYAQTEKYAKKNKVGLWTLQNPVPPWEWRQTK